MQRLAVLLLWCLLALVPLRGWAHGQMLANPAAMDAVAAVSPPPCHEAPHAGSGVADPSGPANAVDAAGVAPGAHGTCTLCAMCHAAGLPAHLPVLLPSTLATHVLQSPPAPGPCSAWPSGVFRPPRRT